MAHAIKYAAETGVYAQGAGFFARIRKAYADYRRYLATASELQQLSDRDLADLGLNRDSIKQIASESVYGA
jgi:uncharacterized protein YjiS (DUF1127 family)